HTTVHCVLARYSARLLPYCPAPTASPYTTLFRSYLAYVNELVPRMRPGGLVLLDNVLWGGAVIDPAADDEHTLAIRACNDAVARSEEHTSELQSRENLVCRLLLEKKKYINTIKIL